MGQKTIFLFLIQQGPFFKQLPEAAYIFQEEPWTSLNLKRFSGKSGREKSIQMAVLELFSLFWIYPGIDFRSNKCDWTPFKALNVISC